MKFQRALIILILITLVVVLLLISTPPFTRRIPSDINVILLTVDSLRPDHLGCYGYKRPTSPNIDAIAEGGQLFRHAYSQSAWTMPGIMSIFTSLQPSVHQVEERGDLLDSNIPTIFDCFHDAGYTVPNICFLLTVPEFSTIRVGPAEQKYFSGEDGQELLRWLDENHDTKFFIWYSYRGVHLPYKPKKGPRSGFAPGVPDEDRLSDGIRAVLSDAAVVPVGTVKLSQADRPVITGLYDTEVREMDQFVGQIYARLRKFGLVEKTLVVITADHGEELMDHGFVGNASTMHSATLYDEIIRIPLIMSLPGYLPGGIEFGEKVQQIDIMPTILDIVGIPIPSSVQGRNLTPSFFEVRQRQESSVPVFAETVYGGYQATEEMAKTRLKCVRTDAWKLIEIEGPQGKTFQLYDLLLDPKELHDVYGENVQKASPLQTLLAEWKQQNSIRRKMVAARAAAEVSSRGEDVCPQWLFPYDGVVLNFDEREGMIRSMWTGTSTATYVIEYDIGAGIYHLTGSFVAFGNQRDFGPYAREIWNSLIVRNPWRVRISPDIHPRCWSEWVEFNFE